MPAEGSLAAALGVVYDPLNAEDCDMPATAAAMLGHTVAIYRYRNGGWVRGQVVSLCRD